MQRSTDGSTWNTVGTPRVQPLVGNDHGTRNYTDPTSNASAAALYRVVARNAVGYGGAFPSLTVQSTSASAAVNAPAAPTGFTATLQAGPRAALAWNDVANNETGYVVQRSTGGGAWTQLAALPAGARSYSDTSVTLGSAYSYRVGAVNVAATVLSPAVDLTVAAPAAPVPAASAARVSTNREQVAVTWADVTGESGYTVQWSSERHHRHGLVDPCGELDELHHREPRHPGLVRPSGCDQRARHHLVRLGDRPGGALTTPTA